MVTTSVPTVCSGAMPKRITVFPLPATNACVSDSSSTHELSARAAHGPARCVLLPRDAFRQFTSAHTMQFDTLVRIIVAQHWRLVTQVLTQFLNLPAMNTVESVRI